MNYITQLALSLLALLAALIAVIVMSTVKSVPAPDEAQGYSAYGYIDKPGWKPISEFFEDSDTIQVNQGPSTIASLEVKTISLEVITDAQIVDGKLVLTKAVVSVLKPGRQ